LNSTDYQNATAWMTQFRGATAQVVTKFPPTPDLGDLKTIPAGKEYAFLGKVRWLKEASEQLKTKAAWQGKMKDWEPLNLAIIEYPDPNKNPAGRTFCERQGRCFLGCLPGARHTLNKTIISHMAYPFDNNNQPLPATVGVRALCEVTDIRKLAGGGYEIHYEDLRFGDDDAGRHNVVTARVVVLSTGCLPSNEMMLKLQKSGWKVSGMVGKKFSTNGDYAGFIDYTRTPGDKMKFNPSPFPIAATKGPINASHVKFRDGNVLINFEDATLPPMLAPYVRTALDVITNAAHRDPFLKMLSGMWKLQFQDFGEDPDVRQPGNYMTEAETLQNTFFFNMMGRDESRGTFSLDNKNNLKLSFAGGLVNDPIYQRIEEVIGAMVSAMNERYPNNTGTYFRFPFWGKSALLNNDFTPDRKFITVHPLGGCTIGTDASRGVVNTAGQVFDTSNAGDLTKVHQDFYIADASVVPGPLAVNPTLTIVALAQKIGAGIT
jgi:cholesterol oxidase